MSRRIIYTADTPFFSGGFADRLIGMAAVRLLARRHGRKFGIEFKRDLRFFDTFCPVLQDIFEILEDERNTPVANLVDGNLTLNKLKALESWLSSNPQSAIRVCANGINSDLALHLGWSELNVRQIVSTFCNDFLLTLRSPQQDLIANYAKPLGALKSVGIHLRTGKFTDGAKDGATLSVYADELVKTTVERYPDAQLYFVASDNYDEKRRLVELLERIRPVLSLPTIASHLERSCKTSDLSGLSSIGDWIMLANCSLGVVGTSGRYAMTAAYAGRIPFDSVPLSR
jgi:hypothetical protein